MRAPQTLVQAAMNRLTARLGSSLADAAAGLAVLAQDAPERLRREWDLFREEVELEAQRLEQPETPMPGHAAGGGATATGGSAAGSGAAGGASNLDPQDQIDALRATVARLARRLEEQS
jgi:hypothetical protein